MPNLRGIITAINTGLKSNNFKTRKFQKGIWNGLAYQVEREDGDNRTVQPAIIDMAGDGTDVSYDDTFPIQFYHRLLSPVTIEDDQRESFGNPTTSSLVEVAPMIMICMGDRNLLGVYQEDIADAICADMIREIDAATLGTLNLQSVIVEPLEIDVDTKRVFSQEFEGVPYKFPLQFFMLSVKYRITTLYSKSCFNLCN